MCVGDSEVGVPPILIWHWARRVGAQLSERCIGIAARGVEGQTLIFHCARRDGMHLRVARVAAHALDHTKSLDNVIRLALNRIVEGLAAIAHLEQGMNFVNARDAAH